MSQCLHITLSMKLPKNFLQKTVQKQAQLLNIEGTAQIMSDKIKIIACGTKENIEEFLDVLHAEAQTKSIDLAIEPFFKEKDYRGVFRVLE